MKNFKKIFLFGITLFLSFSFVISPFLLGKKTNQKTVFADVVQKNMFDNSLDQFVSISTAGQKLKNENVKTIDTNDDGVLDTSYIVANGSISLNFNYEKYNYNAIFESSHFYSPITKSVELEKDSLTSEFPNTFSIGSTDFKYIISAENVMTLYNVISNGNERLAYHTNSGNFVTYSDTESTRTITFITGYTLKADAPDTSFTFEAYEANGQTSSNVVSRYCLNFQRPILDFKTEDVVMFTCQGLDVGDTPSIDSKLERELSYETVNLEFQNNDYTETNPLYFDINHNGFVYTFTLFSKHIGANDYLFVEYYDEQKPNNNQSLATVLNKTTHEIDTPILKFDSEPNFNKFSINFSRTGRYEISIYDLTYKLGLKSNNFYNTSFYIKNDSSSAFDNAYIIFQAFDDDNNPLDYVVSDSTQNTNIQTTIKNLPFYFEKDDPIKNFEKNETNLFDFSDNDSLIKYQQENADTILDLPIIEFVKTTLSGSINIPTSTFYTKSQILEMLDENQNMIFLCSDDAFYEIKIYRYSVEQRTNGEIDYNYYSVIDSKSYQFTLVKQPKISYTIPITNDDGDQIYDSNNKPVTQFHEADTPFVTTEENYSRNIKANMTITTKFSNSALQYEPQLNKTYVNSYKVLYAMQSVKIEQATSNPQDPEATGDQLHLQFWGIGTIDVEVTLNGVTTTYEIQSQDYLSFSSYGKYNIKYTDSMGTVGTATFNHSKPVSVSALILIGLVGFIAVALILFIISSRAKVKTR